MEYLHHTGVEGCLWLRNVISRSSKTFPKRKDPALFFKAEGPFRSFFSFLLTLLLIGGWRYFPDSHLFASSTSKNNLANYERLTVTVLKNP